VLKTLQHLQRLTSYGVAWRSFTEQYLDSTGIFREAVIGILAAIAKQERVRLRPASKADAEMIQRMRAEGASWSEIARRTGLARATCQKVCDQVTATAG
jgi:DNA invertase Pin-like site-specific DNA recombinase